jgi:hypothetical protein
MWQRVDELEAMSRNPDAFTPLETISVLADPSIVPVDQLIAARSD